MISTIYLEMSCYSYITISRIALGFTVLNMLNDKRSLDP